MCGDEGVVELLPEREDVTPDKSDNHSMSCWKSSDTTRHALVIV